jgi:ACS family hexuronate transporter-like MFS transporter
VSDKEAGGTGAIAAYRPIAGGPPNLSRRMSWALALTATFTMAVSYFDRQTLAVLAPTVTKELNISEEGYSWLISAFSIAYLIGSPLAGRLIDVIGARRGLLGAVLLWSSVAALHALAPGFGVLFALRIALGLTESPSFPGAAQTIRRALPPSEQGRGFGVLFTGSSFGAMAAAPLAVFLATRWGFRVAFLGTALIGLLWVPLWILVAWNPIARRALDHGLANAGANTTTTTTTATKSASDAPRDDDTASREESSPPPTMLELLANPAVLRGIAVVLACAPILSFALNWSSKFLVATYGLKQADVGFLLIVPPLLFDIGSLTFGHLASQHARRRKNDGTPPRLVLLVAAACAASGMAIPFAGGPWGSVFLTGIAMAGGGGLFAILTSDMLVRVHPRAVSSAGGITAAAQSLAYIVANPIVGRSIEQTGGYTFIVVALGLWVIPGCALWLLWSPPPNWAGRAGSP